MGPYKVFWKTGGVDPDCAGKRAPQVSHNPPLVFNVEKDPAESTLLTSKSTPDLGQVRCSCPLAHSWSSVEPELWSRTIWSKKSEKKLVLLVWLACPTKYVSVEPEAKFQAPAPPSKLLGLPLHSPQPWMELFGNLARVVGFFLSPRYFGHFTEIAWQHLSFYRFRIRFATEKSITAEMTDCFSVIWNKIRQMTITQPAMYPGSLHNRHRSDDLKSYLSLWFSTVHFVCRFIRYVM